MGRRRDKGLATARYLVGNIGIPGLTWDASTGQIDAPYPYVIPLATERKLETWHDLIRVEPDDRLRFSILYNYGMDSLDQAWVGMQMRSFTPLLTAHYDTIRYRGET